MSDMLTHWAVFDDCRRLVQFDDRVDPTFQRVVETERNHARIGAVIRGEGIWITPILERAREQWNRPEMHPELDRRVAFCLAGLAHTACDLAMKPLMEASVLADEASQTPSKDANREVYAYHDTYVFRQIYLNGNEEPFNRFLLAENETAPGLVLENFAQTVFQGETFSCHSIVRISAEPCSFQYCEAAKKLGQVD